jgi:hypothetical protein
MRRFLAKPVVAWTGLGLCLATAFGAVLYQKYENHPIDLPAVAFGVAGIIAAIFALLITESTLEGINTGIRLQTDRLSDEITNLEDATRRNLSGFAEIFARALWLLKQAEEEVWYINFLFCFGEPHKANQTISVEYARIAKMLGINPNFAEAVQEFYKTWLDKVRTIPVLRALTLNKESLRTLCLDKLALRPDYTGLKPDEIITAELACQKAIEKSKNLRLDYVAQDDCIIQNVERLPLQLFIARIRSRGGEDRKWGCLVFLVGTENMGNHKPRGFYTELDHVVDVYKELALGFMQPEITTVGPPTSAPAEVPIEGLH